MDMNNEIAHRAISAFSEECKRTQLQNVLSSLPEEQQKRFMPAAMQAACVLEWLSPAIMAPLPMGPVAGVYSAINPDAVAFVAASPKKALYSAAAISNLDLAAQNGLVRIAEADRFAGGSAGDHFSLYGHIIAKLLDKHGFAPEALSALPEPLDLAVFAELMAWRSKGAFELVRICAEKRIAVALLALGAEDGEGFLTISICYARHCPPEILESGNGQEKQERASSKRARRRAKA